MEEEIQKLIQLHLLLKVFSPGSHKVKLEVVNLNNESYGLSKEFMVNIPK